MPVSFRQARTVQPGQRIRSQDLTALANAINDRLTSGLGDGPWRLGYYWLSGFRQIRNPDDGGNLWPPQAEFHHVYQNLKPTDAQWPVAGPGDGEGVNVASTFGSFVFGADAAGILPEDERVTDPAVDGVPLTLGLIYTPQTAWEKWTLGKRQRGAFDPTTGALGSPSFTAARMHYYLRQSLYSPHGNSYGGFAPTPEATGVTCADLGDGITRYQYTIFFTPLRDGLATKTYTGFCADLPGDLKAVYYTPFDYIVQGNSGSIEILSKQDYIEGPYTGGSILTKQSGDHIQRAINAWAGEFRGTEEQRADELSGNSGWMTHAFSVQRFMTSQYLLAPARGHQELDGLGHVNVVPDYPQATVSGALTVASGTRLTFAAEGSAHTVQPGAVAAAWAVLGQKLAGPVTVSLLNGSAVVGSATITPDATTQAGSAVVRIEEPLPAGSVLSFRLDSSAAFTEVSSTAGIVAEVAELYEYRPGPMDLYLVLRLAGARFSDGNGTDGSGLDETDAKELGEDYFSNCMVMNRRGELALPGSLAAINTNAVFDSARRLSRHVRILPRWHLVDYAVEGGKSVLWFRRLSFGLGNDTPSDSFDGIGPARSAIPSGSLTIGRSYKVVATSGAVTHARKNYGNGQTFTATETEYQTTGDAAVWEADGIISTAPPKGWTNEWMLGVALMGYSDSDSSIWKASAYSDYFANAAVDRCNFWTPSVPTVAKDIIRHFNTNASGGGQFTSGSAADFIAPENPPGYRYAKTSFGLNRLDCGGDPACEDRRKNFYRSCRVFEPDPEIESVVSANQWGEERVKVTLKTRLHSTNGFTSGAASSITAGPAGWDVVALRAEPFRSIENGLREYLVNQVLGTNCLGDGYQAGNASIDSTISGLPDSPWGACYPSFRLTQLMPRPYEDGNDTPGSNDTPFTHDWFTQAELYLRVMAEGYVDGATSERYGCESGINAVYDYTFPNLCYDAFKGRSFTTLPAEVTKTLDAADVREDKPEGYGPLPTVKAAAEAFNQYALAVNKLDKVRVMLPFKFQYREGTEYVYQPTQFMNTDESATISLSSGQVGFATQFPTEAPYPGTFSSWADGIAASSTIASTVDYPATGGTGDGLINRKTIQEWRYETTDPDAVEAIPDAWRSQLSTRSAALLATQTVVETTTLDRVGAGSGSSCLTVADAWPSSSGYLLFGINQAISNGCKFALSGAEVPPSLGRQVYYFFGGSSVPNSCGGGASNTATISPILPDAIVFQVPTVDQ